MSVRRGLGHDDFVLEAAGSDEEQDGPYGKQRQGVDPKVRQPRSTQNNAARDVDVIARRNEIADDVEDRWHGFAREDIAGEKYARQKSEESELDRFRLRVGFAGHEDADRKGHKQIRQRKKRQQQNAAMNRHQKYEAHEREDQAKLAKADR